MCAGGCGGCVEGKGRKLQLALLVFIDPNDTRVQRIYYVMLLHGLASHFALLNQLRTLKEDNEGTGL